MEPVLRLWRQQVCYVTWSNRIKFPQPPYFTRCSDIHSISKAEIRFNKQVYSVAQLLIYEYVVCLVPKGLTQRYCQPSCGPPCYVCPPCCTFAKPRLSALTRPVSGTSCMNASVILWCQSVRVWDKPPPPLLSQEKVQIENAAAAMHGSGAGVDKSAW